MEKEYSDEDSEKKVISILWQCISELEAWHRMLEEADGEICEGCSLCTLITRAEETNTEFICVIFEREGLLSRPTIAQKVYYAVCKALGKRVKNALGEEVERHSYGNRSSPYAESESRIHPMLDRPDREADDSGRSAGRTGARSGIYLVQRKKHETDEEDQGGDVS